MAITVIQTADVTLGKVISIITVEIQASASVSDAFQIPPGFAIAGIAKIGAGWDAGDLALKVTSTEGGSLLGPVMAPGGTSYVKCAIAADVPVAFPFSDLIKWPWAQLLSCTANNAADVTPVAQAAKRTIEIVLAPAFN